MKNSKGIDQSTFNGAGYLVGAIIGIVAAITAFVFTENIAISIPLFAGLSIPFGMSIEQKFQAQAKDNNPSMVKFYITLIAIGVLVSLSAIFIAKFI